MKTHTSLTARIMTPLIHHGSRLARRFGGDAPEVDGRRLDPRFALILRLMERLRKPFDESRVHELREELSRARFFGPPIPADVQAVDRTIVGPGGRLPIRVYRSFAAEARPPAIVYAHGGGWVTGSLLSHDVPCRRIAARTGCVVIAVDYRLAPEHRFPAALDDVLAAYRWTHEHADELSILGNRIGLMGDSAGGNLAAAAAVQLAGGDLPPPVAQCLIYPATDLTCQVDSYKSLGQGFGLSSDAMDFFIGCYLTAPEQKVDPRISPLFAADHRGLAPAIIATAGFDPLRDDGRVYADTLRRAGVPVIYRCFDDMIHGFFNIGIVPTAIGASDEICRHMATLMHSPE